jgi:LPPG:FO 2-phospho-L-lactate transferase
MSNSIVMLCGGVGGARAALALYENLTDDRLTLVVNTGDDFEHLGLQVWPDWDTVVYHLAGVQDPVRGWGRSDEGLRVMEELERLGSPTWFHLGDRDVALHIHRSWRIRQGLSHPELCREVCSGFGLTATVLPVTEQGLSTKLRLADGQLMDFQDWFVEHRGEPEVHDVVNQDAASLSLTEGVTKALEGCDLLLFAPSNPYLSLGPMLKHPGLRKTIENLGVPKLAVSPLIDGKAVKGPLDRLIATLSTRTGQDAIAHFWAEIADALLLPGTEIATVKSSPLSLHSCPTLLKSRSDRRLFVSRLLEIWREMS